MKMMEILAGDTEFCSTLSKKLAPPLVTLLSSEPEVQYVALRNMNLIVQKRPDILKHEMKVWAFYLIFLKDTKSDGLFLGFFCQIQRSHLCEA